MLGTTDDGGPTLFTDDVLKEGWGLAFYALGFGVQDLDTWRLEHEEADELTVRTKKFISSIDKKALKKFEKRWGKYFPAGMLALAFCRIAGPRAVHTWNTKRGKNSHAEPLQSTTETGRTQSPGGPGRPPVNPGAPVAPGPTRVVDVAGGSRNGNENGAQPNAHHQRGVTQVAELPLRRTDGPEFFNEDGP